MPSIATTLRAFRELGLAQVAAYARYQVARRSGWLWRQSRAAMETAGRTAPPAPALGVFPLPDPSSLNDLLSLESQAHMVQTADEISAGQFSLFGAPPEPLYFTLPVPLAPWPQHESQTWLPAPNSLDIKFLWEPARFGWAVQLARAAHLMGDPEGKYHAAFWAHTERFRIANPPGYGPNWASAQEAALRLISLSLAWEIFGPASPPQQAVMLAAELAMHAARIPPSLDYARAQNNNHRLSEAAGLYTAGLYLPGHPQAPRWRELGWQEFHEGLTSQVSSSGEYCQHSTNYHRLMLQLALWVYSLAAQAGDTFPAASLERLDSATRWLAGLVDETSGAVPNLGPNDGAFILPLTGAPYGDYRPVLQTASQAFCGALLLPPGEWDEMCAWLTPLHSLPTPIREGESAQCLAGGGSRVYFTGADTERKRGILRGSHSWAALRAANFTSRPGHADQLHFDLWWRGLNLALDAGTYLYNAPSPWDNRLVGADVHNTLTVNDEDQMQRAGRFLYLAPAQAEITESLRSPDGSYQRVTARHHGYHKLNALHVRGISLTTSGIGEEWLVQDQVVAKPSLFPKNNPYRIRLHWLLPDLPWTLDEIADGWALALQTAFGLVHLHIQTRSPGALTLGRAGKVVAGEGEMRPTWGWFSPNYGQLQPALSLAVVTEGTLPLTFTSRWLLPR